MNVDLRRYLRATVGAEVTETDLGFIKYNCSLCRETRGRGWMHVESFAAGCWNSGCVANPRMAGGAVGWVQEREGLGSWHAALGFLIEWYPGTPGARRLRPPVEDFCTLPPSTPALDSHLGAEAFVFAETQWGATRELWERHALAACGRGPFSGRIIMPVVVRGHPVTFTARTFRRGEPKYLAAKVGRDSGRGVGEVLYGMDGVRKGHPVLLVEGPGDVIGWEAHQPRAAESAVALCGTSLNPEKTAALLALRPAAVTVALDATALPASARVAAALRAWGLEAGVASWHGGKDAGAGATLRPLGDGLRDLAKARMT